MADEYEGKEDMGGDMIDESKYDQDDPNGVMDERYDDDDDDMGYDDMDLDAFGEGLPPFASKAARELDALVKDKERTLDEIDGQLGENSERVEIMQEHLKNVRQELLHTQALVDAKNREIGTESHLKQLSERGIGRVKSDIRKKDNEREDLQDSLNVIQNAIFRGNEKMDQFKLQMNWNQEELEQWALAAKQKEEDSLALQKYTRADEAKVKELTLQIQKVTQEVSSSKKKLDDEVTDTQAKQIELDKTAEEFRALHR
jgi:coiled-coil domain-containing protein 39